MFRNESLEEVQLVRLFLFCYGVVIICGKIVFSRSSSILLGELYFDETPLQIYYEYSRYTALTLFAVGIGFVLWYHIRKRLKKNEEN